MAKKTDQVPEDKLELYRKAIEAQGEIELEGGLKLPNTSTNGYMFSSLSKDGRLGLRLSKEDTEAFLEEYDDAVPFKNYGASIKEHVEVPDALLNEPEELATWLTRSFRYTKGLPAKK